MTVETPRMKSRLDTLLKLAQPFGLTEERQQVTLPFAGKKMRVTLHKGDERGVPPCVILEGVGGRITFRTYGQDDLSMEVERASRQWRSASPSQVLNHLPWRQGRKPTLTAFLTHHLGRAA